MAAEHSRSRRRRTRRRRRIIAVVGLAVLGAGGAAAYASTGSSGPNLQLATVTLASVTETVESSGTLTSSTKATPSFSVAGTVTAIKVKIGQAVSQGQTLAQLDTTSLRDSIDSANSTLASAKQQLEADKTGQTSTGSGSSAAAGSGATTASYKDTSLTSASNSNSVLSIAAAPTTPAASPPASSTSLSALTARVQAAQTAVIAAQHSVDTDQAAIDTAQKQLDADILTNTGLRDKEKTACTTPTGTPSDACTSATADYQAYADTLSSDSASLDKTISAQDAAVTNLDTAITTLDTLIDQLKKAAASAGTTTTPPTGSTGSGSTGQTGKTGTGTGSGPGTGTGAGAGSSGGGQSTTGGGQSTTVVASAAQLAADQASIDSAQAQANEAKQNLTAATLTSPISGKVAAIGLTAGAGSSGKTITIVGTGIQKVSTTVPLAQIDLIKVGQPVSVAADGVTTKLQGTVESIGMLSSTSGSSTTFPVTVLLNADSPVLYDGTGADVVITTRTARNAITVPNSAIAATTGSGHTVTVYTGGKTSTARVTLGVAGTASTQIVTGLKLGQQVVLAQLSKALPSSTSSTSTTGFPSFLSGTGGIPNFGGGGGR